MPNDTKKAKKINGIDDAVIVLTVDQKNNIYYVNENHQVYIYDDNNGTIVKIEGLND